jgi:hypothetical protein
LNKRRSDHEEDANEARQDAAETDAQAAEEKRLLSATPLK